MADDRAAPPEGQPQRRTHRAKPDSLFTLVIWGRVVMGLALATVGGIAFGHAWTRDYLPWWIVGGITLLTGILLILSGVYARSGAKRLPEAPAVAAPEERDPLVPLLGALLVYKYQYVSQEQLNRALELQRRRRNTGHRIGEVLVEMGVINRSQLLEALAFQRAQSSRKRSATHTSEASQSPQ